MSKDVRVIVLRAAGTNCDRETAFAFQSCGASVDLVHINRLFKKEVCLSDFHILAIPGGFTYGDDIASGRILANELRLRLGEEIQRFVREGKLILGICNGFQILVKAGILPGGNSPGGVLKQSATLTHNDSGKFEDRWVRLKPEGKSVWTKGLKNVIFLPVAHAEGKFIAGDEALFKELAGNGQAAFRYTSSGGKKPEYPENPNGSAEDIAGISDATGRVLGLMPHPERHVLSTQHPSWTRLSQSESRGDGAIIFENGVTYVREELL